MSKAMLYAYVTGRFSSGDVAGTLYDHEGEPLHDHLSSSEGWLWHDLTTGFRDRAEKLDALYPDGYDVTCIGFDASDEARAPLFALWDKNHPGWRDATDEPEE